MHYRLAGTSVKVLETLPPWVDTGLSQAQDASKVRPETVAKAILRGLEHDRAEVRIGQVKALYAISRVAPSFAERLLNKSRAG